MEREMNELKDQVDVFLAANNITGVGDSNVIGGEGSGDNENESNNNNNLSGIKGPWSPEEDNILSRLVAKFGPRNWSIIARGIPGRSGKSCRLRWCNQLDPGVKRKPFTEEEDRIIIAAHAVHGNKWAVLARLLPGRTDNAIKNHWNSTLRKGRGRVNESDRFRATPREIISRDKTKASSEDMPSLSVLPGRTDNAMKNLWNSTLRRDRVRLNESDRFKVISGEMMGDISHDKTKASSEEILSLSVLPGRTDSGINNHCSSTLQRDCGRLNGWDRFKATSGEMMRDISHDKMKASPEETMSCGDVNSFKSLEGKDVNSLDILSGQYGDRAPSSDDYYINKTSEPPTLFRPAPRVSAFNIYNSPNCSTNAAQVSRVVPSNEPPIQTTATPEFSMCGLFEGLCGEPLVPSRCGHGCCDPKGVGMGPNSLLGPEFVEYEELPPFSSHELAAIASDLSKIAWLKSGLESSNTKVMDSSGTHGVPQGVCVGGGKTDAMSHQMSSQTFVLPAKS